MLRKIEGHPEEFTAGHALSTADSLDTSFSDWRRGSFLLERAGIPTMLSTVPQQLQAPDLRIGNATFRDDTPEGLDRQYHYQRDGNVSLEVGWNYKNKRGEKRSNSYGVILTYNGFFITASPTMESIQIAYGRRGHFANTLFPRSTWETQLGKWLIEEELRKAYKDPLPLETYPISPVARISPLAGISFPLTFTKMEIETLQHIAQGTTRDVTRNTTKTYKKRIRQKTAPYTTILWGTETPEDQLKFDSMSVAIFCAMKQGLIDIDAIPTGRFTMLTDVELAVVNLIIDGYERKIIPRLLYKSPETMDSNIRDIYKKLGIHSYYELVFMGAKERLLYDLL